MNPAKVVEQFVALLERQNQLLEELLAELRKRSIKAGDWRS